VATDPFQYFTTQENIDTMLVLSNNSNAVYLVRDELLGEQAAKEAESRALCAQLPQLSGGQAVALPTKRHESGQVLLGAFAGMTWVGVGNPSSVWCNWLRSALEHEVGDVCPWIDRQPVADLPLVAYGRVEGSGPNNTPLVNVAAFRICLRLLTQRGLVAKHIVDEAYQCLMQCLMRVKVGDESLVNEVLQNAQSAPAEAREFVMGAGAGDPVLAPAVVQAIATAVETLLVRRFGDPQHVTEFRSKQLQEEALVRRIRDEEEQRKALFELEWRAAERRDNEDQQVSRQRVAAQRAAAAANKAASEASIRESLVKRALADAQLKNVVAEERSKKIARMENEESWVPPTTSGPSPAGLGPSMPQEWVLPLYGSVPFDTQDPYGVGALPTFPRQPALEILGGGSGMDLTEDPGLVLAFAACDVSFVPSRAATMRIDRGRVPPPFVYPKVDSLLAPIEAWAGWSSEQAAAYAEGYRRNHGSMPLFRTDAERHSVTARTHAVATKLCSVQRRAGRLTWKEQAMARGFAVSTVEQATKKAALFAFQTHWLHVQWFLEEFVRLTLEAQVMPPERAGAPSSSGG
jgi:hypothetical protein